MSTARPSVMLAPGDGPLRPTPWGEEVVQKVSGELTGGAFSIEELAVPVGGGRAAYVHHGGDECFYVLAGRFSFWLDGHEVSAVRGSLLYVPRGAARSFQNSGDHDARLLVIQTPGEALERCPEDTEQSEVAATAGRTTRAVTAAVAARYGIERL